MRSLKLDMQFLDHHRKQYLDLHAELSKIEYSPQSEAALTNFKALLLLEIVLLAGCDYDWSPPAAGAGAGAVLPAAARSDDGDASPVEDAAEAAPAGAAAAGAAAPAGAAAHADILDVNDFTTWTPDTWALLDWDTIAFPSDPAINVASVRYYVAVAMILWYQADLREKHKRVWDELNFAWLATFSCDLHAVGLEKWPVTGPFAFDESQSKWLTDTLRFLKMSAGRPRRQGALPRAPAVVPPPAVKSKRNSDPVVQSSKRYKYFDFGVILMIEIIFLIFLLL